MSASAWSFFGLLRCLGATRRQVLRFVRREALQWCITAIPIGIGLSIVVVWGLCAVMRQLSTVWFGYMPIFGISWLSIGVSIVLGLITVLLAARTPAKMAAKVSPLEAVTGNTQQESSFRHAANTRRWHVEVALGIHHAKAKRRSYILMTGAFAICITLFRQCGAAQSGIQEAGHLDRRYDSHRPRAVYGQQTLCSNEPGLCLFTAHG